MQLKCKLFYIIYYITMNSNFDLDIKNYSKKELEDILDLPINYNEGIINMRETKLRQNIINDKNISNEIKTKTITFISTVKTNLITILHNENIPNNEISSLATTYKNVYNLNTNLHSTDTVSAGSSIIIKQPPTPYGQSFPSEFYQGTINPLNKRILRQNINIDTRFRENYYSTLSSNFHVSLPIRLTQVVSLQLSAIELPNTLYTISKVYGNNFFVLKIEEQSLIVTIPDGNYNYLALQNYINAFLESSATYLNFSQIQFLVDIANDTGSGKMIIGSKDGNFNFSVNFLSDKFGNDDTQTPLPLKLGWLMGFREGYYENNKTYISEGIVNLIGPRYAYLVIDDFNNNVNDGFYAAFTSSILNKNILARISLQGDSFNISSQNNLMLITTPRQYFGPVDIQKLQIQLLDEYGRILNLNNMDYSFCLTFQTVYDL
jgi:hypothetical protein